MDELKLYELLDTREDEYHDFKEIWYKKNKQAELVKDIFSFVNTTHHEDSYLIMGVTDDLKIVGVETDENRKNQQNIIDFLRGLPIAGQVIPKITIETITILGHEIDVITIHNTDNVPVFLSESKEFKFKNEKGKQVTVGTITAGQIFSREKDVNTAIDGTVDFHQTEQLWKKRLGLDLPIDARYGHVLDDHSNWSYYENRDWESGFLYMPDPDFHVLLHDLDEDDERQGAESYSIKQFKTKMGWKWIDLMYRNIKVESYLGVFLDGARLFIATPNMAFVRLSEDNPVYTQSYYRLIKDENDFKFLNMMMNAKKRMSTDADAYRIFLDSIVVYDSIEHAERIERKVEQLYPELKDAVNPTEDEINSFVQTMGMDFSSKSSELEPDNVAYMLSQLKTAIFINTHWGELQ